MRTFIREKKIFCGSDYLEVDIFPYTKTEEENARRGKRRKKEIEPIPNQVDWNEINSKRSFNQKVHTNFGEGDILLSLTYANANLPPTAKKAEQELRNYLDRVSYYRKKNGLPPLKYIAIPKCEFKKDGVTPTRIHHHIIMNGGVDRDVLEDLWRKRKKKGQKKGDKIGYANAVRIQPDECGLAALCSYLAKQGDGKKRWSSSQNLDKPEKEVTDPDSPPKENVSRFSASRNLENPWSRTNDHKFSRKEVERIAKNPPDHEYWKRRYPGYEIIGDWYGYNAVYSEIRGWALYLKLRRIKE